MNTTNETYNVYEGPRHLGVSSNRVRVLLAEERLPGARKIGRKWEIPADALEPLRQRKQEAIR